VVSFRQLYGRSDRRRKCKQLAWSITDAVGGDTSNIKSDTVFEVSAITTQTAQEAFDTVLAWAGAMRPNGIPLINALQVKQRVTLKYYMAAFLGSLRPDRQPDEVGGWPAYHTPSEDKIPADTDHDGMPDDWENNNGLNAGDPEDGKLLRMTDIPTSSIT